MEAQITMLYNSFPRCILYSSFCWVHVTHSVQQLNSYKISTEQVSSYKAWTSPSYKDCKEIVVETKNMELSLEKGF